jgi:hypothetical protein
MVESTSQKSETPQSLVLDLETLNVQYSNLLTQYEQAVANYTNLIQQQSASNTSPPLMTIPNNAFWGTADISSNIIPTVYQCKALCATTSGCSGATYNTTTQTCSLRSGEGSLVPSASNLVALIPEETYLLLNMQSINAQLIQINQEILNKTTAGETVFDSEYTERQTQAEELLKNYIMLTAEKNKINGMINDFENLNQEEIDGNITISKNYYSFVLLLILSIALIVLLFMFSGSSSTNANANSSMALPIPNMYQSNNQYGGKLGISAYFIIFAIILIVLVIKYFSNISSFIKSFK